MRMSSENQILDLIRNGIRGYANDLAGYKILLFGSRARRNHRERSDFDLGVYGSTPISLATFYKIGDFLDDLPTLYSIDWVDLNRASAALREDALKNAVIIYG